MTRTKNSFILAGILVLAGLSTARAEVTILTVNVNKSAENYYKVQEFLEEMKASQEQAQEKVAGINEAGKVLEQEYKELVEQASSDILTETARKEAADDARIKYQEVAQKQNELKQFVEGVQRSISAREQTQMSLFTKEINEVIVEIAKERSATIVLDVSGASRNGLPTVIFSADGLDVTDEVISRINATKAAE